MPPPIFVVDSSPGVRRLVEQISSPEGFEVVGFQDGPAALEAARRTSPALIIADYHLDNMTFAGFCKEINKLDNLSETYLISLINPADRPDENHLRIFEVDRFDESLRPGDVIVLPGERLDRGAVFEGQLRAALNGDPGERHFLNVCPVGVSGREPKILELLDHIGDAELLAARAGKAPLVFIGGQDLDMPHDGLGIDPREVGDLQIGRPGAASGRE